MKRIIPLAISAGALMATASAAPAFEFTGGSFGLSYSSTDVDGTTLDGFGYKADANAALGDALSVGVTFGSANYSTDAVPFDQTVANYGLSIDYAVAPNATVGAFYERNDISFDGVSGELNIAITGIEGSLALSDQASVSGYWGKWSGKDVDSAPSDIFSYGLRGDFSVGNGIGLYASYMEDSTDGADSHRTAFGASYDLGATGGVPILVEASYSTLDGTDLPDSYSTFNVGVRYTFGAVPHSAAGFHGGHAAATDGPAIFF